MSIIILYKVKCLIGSLSNSNCACFQIRMRLPVRRLSLTVGLPTTIAQLFAQSCNYDVAADKHWKRQLYQEIRSTSDNTKHFL